MGMLGGVTRGARLRAPKPGIAGRGFAQQVSLCCYGRPLEQVEHRQIAPKLTLQHRVHFDDQQRMTADVEEVLMQSDTFDLQNFATRPQPPGAVFRS